MHRFRTRGPVSFPYTYYRWNGTYLISLVIMYNRISAICNTLMFISKSTMVAFLSLWHITIGIIEGITLRGLYLSTTYLGTHICSRY